MPKSSSSSPGSSSSSSSGKVFGARISPALAREIKILAAEKDTSVQDILIEALGDVLKKYGKKVPKE